MKNKDDLKSGIYPTEYNEKVEVGLPTDEVTMVPETRYGKISGIKLLKMRRKPGSGDVVSLVMAADKIKILSEEGEYYKVDVRGKTGYILSRFCKEV